MRGRPGRSPRAFYRLAGTAASCRRRAGDAQGVVIAAHGDLHRERWSARTAAQAEALLAEDANRLRIKWRRATAGGNGSLEDADGPQNHDQEDGADQRDDEAPDRSEGSNPEHARHPVTEDRPDDAYDNVRKQTHLHVGLHDEAG